MTIAAVKKPLKLGQRFFSAVQPFLMGSVCGLLGLELLFQLLPVKNAHDFRANTEREPVLRATNTTLKEPIDWKFSQTHLRTINNYGFVDNNNYQTDRMPVAIIGDSYVQSSMLPYAESVSGRIHDRLMKDRNIPAYSYGVPGYSFAGYIGTAKYITDTFKPQAYVFVLSKGDLDDSLLASSGSYYLTEDGSLKFTDGGPSRLRQTIEKSSLYRYTERQLRFNWEGMLYDNILDRGRVARGKAAREKNQNSTVRSRSADLLLEHLTKNTQASTKNTVFIIDTDRDFIYGRNRKFDRQDLDDFKAAITAKGYRTIDTHDLFVPYHKKTRKQVDFLPTDFHWNAKGSELVADRLHRELSSILDRPN
jgi:hypothetical protein